MLPAVLSVIETMKDFARDFYHSAAWNETRKAYTKYRGGLCEMCMAMWIYRPGTVVHHKTWLTPNNISDPSVTLGWGNLMLLCADHHAEVHKKQRRYVVDADGRVMCAG